MTVKHTPGPWTVEPDGGIGPDVVALGDDGGCSDPDCCGGTTYHVEIKEADAKLIAAAPSLADALERCRVYFDDAETGREPLGQLLGAVRTALRSAGRLP